ncbi:hypothetical protein [Chryseolinea sp. H1M3-3]|nr:hypothetical protein [Chryseolinea sp. H1M3-3]
MEYIIPFQIALGIVFLWWLFRNSILNAYYLQWKSRVRKYFCEME